MTDSRPKVSVVCAWYNRADYIKDTVDSLLNQHFDNYEIIIVNDGSSDPRVKEILDSYSDPKLKIIHQQNMGFVRSIRKAISLSGGDYVAIQGAGEVSLPDRISSQYDFLRENNGYSAVSCLVDQVVVSSTRKEKIEHNKSKSGDVGFEELLRGNPVVHGSLMIEKKIYNSIKGYREFFKYAQDLDLLLRLALKSRIFIIDKVLYERWIFSEDGIAVSANKSILQSYLANFSRECAKYRSHSSIDYIDLFEEQAPLFFQPSRHLRKKNFKSIIKFLFNREFDSAIMYSSFISLPGWGVGRFFVKSMIRILRKSSFLYFCFSKIVFILYKDSFFIKSS